MVARVRTRRTYDRLDDYIDRLPKKAMVAVRRAALEIKFEAQAGAPVDTGFLKASIQMQVTNPLEATVEVHAHYGVYVEFGHRVGRDARAEVGGGGREGLDRRGWVPPQPFFFPAVERVRPQFYQAMRSAVGSI